MSGKPGTRGSRLPAPSAIKPPQVKADTATKRPLTASSSGSELPGNAPKRLKPGTTGISNLTKVKHDIIVMYSINTQSTNASFVYIAFSFSFSRLMYQGP